MLLQNQISSLPLQELNHPLAKLHEVRLHVLRTDLTNNEVSGNKWFKLKYNFEEAIKSGHKTILTFGGAYSNHLYASAYAAKTYGLKLICVIRGEEPKIYSKTLQAIVACGAILHFISREEYRTKNDVELINKLKEKFNNFYLIPEGGSNKLALKGTSEITDFINIKYDYLCCAVGTGGTIAGISNKLRDENIQIIGFPALKNGEFLLNDINDLLFEFNQSSFPNNLSLNCDYHFGGYAKYNTELIDFIKSIENTYNIPFEQVYTGKMIYGVLDLISKSYFKKNSDIVLIHTGGLQGRNF
jgi:1-aminocyclopropane-1-carboxylate deaminase/D-cysteine desulfhydrase-like pyridoxal-dependent ACC family enzyme